MTDNPSGEADPLPIMVESTYVTLAFYSCLNLTAGQKKDLNGEATGCLCPSSQCGHIEYFSVSCFFLTTKLTLLIGLWKVND